MTTRNFTVTQGISVGATTIASTGNLYAFIYGNANPPNTKVTAKFTSLLYTPPAGFTGGLYNT